ncbi:MAG: nucleotidyltransferase domain-containing protein [Actinobacteria bacterium]|nr:nucleotidyltransferase domain-containing protein [Actinomycetota bacterium]
MGRRVHEHRREIRRLVSASGAKNPRVFGSVARGQEHPQSDLDILVDFPVRTYGLLPLAHLADEISRMVGVKVDVAASEASSPPVAATALHDAVPL